MKRISSNESFPRNIILSIDRDYDNLSNNTISFKRFFQNALTEGRSPQEAVEIASEELRRLVEKRKKPFKKFIEEGNALKREQKQKRKENVLRQLSSGTGVSGDELENLWKLFLEKRKNADSDNPAIERTIKQFNDSKPKVEVEKEVPSIDDIRKYFELIRNLEPEYVHHNMQEFKKYILKGMSLSEAFKKVQYIVSARNYMRENNIPVTATNTKIFLVSKGDFELAARKVREKEKSGKLSLDVENLSPSGAETDDYVIYNGQRISLHRLVQNLFFGKTSEKQYKMMYAIIYRNVFDFGKSIDEAVELAYKELNLMKFRDTLKQEFPEDPSYAEHVLESYYIDENMSFQDALEATRRDIGKKPSK